MTVFLLGSGKLQVSNLIEDIQIWEDRRGSMEKMILDQLILSPCVLYLKLAGQFI
jgi:hypothetical protein